MLGVLLGTDGSAERVPVCVDVLVTLEEADVEPDRVPLRDEDMLLLDVPETDEVRVVVIVLLEEPDVVTEIEDFPLKDCDVLTELVRDEVIDLLDDDVDVPDFENVELFEFVDVPVELRDRLLDVEGDIVRIDVLEIVGLPVALLLFVTEVEEDREDVELRDSLELEDVVADTDELLDETDDLVGLFVTIALIVLPGEALNVRTDVPVLLDVVVVV